MTDDAATGDALDVLGVNEDLRERLVPACDFLGSWHDIALEILLFTEEMPKTVSVCVRWCRIFPVASVFLF